jgi:hypothetical protein
MLYARAGPVLVSRHLGRTLKPPARRLSGVGNRKRPIPIAVSPFLRNLTFDSKVRLG